MRGHNLEDTIVRLYCDTSKESIKLKRQFEEAGYTVDVTDSITGPSVAYGALYASGYARIRGLFNLR